MQFLKRVVCFALILSVATTLSADEKKKNKGGRKPASATAQFLKDIELTDAQKEQVAALDKELAEEFSKIRSSREAILTAEQKTAEKEAQKAAKEAGKTGAEAQKAVTEALQLTAEQQEKMKEWNKTQQEFRGKVIEGLKKILTPEQQEKLPKQKSGNKSGKKKKSE